MQQTCQTLSNMAGQIAAASAELVDAEDYTESIKSIVLEILANVPTQNKVDLRTLTNAGLDHSAVCNVLRAIETELIEAFRVAAPKDQFAPCVLSLRQVMRTSRPTSKANQERILEFQNLCSGTADCLGSGEKGIWDFVRGLLRSMRQLVFVHDFQGNLLYVNDYGLEMVRYTREDLLEGTTVYDVVVPAYLELVEERMANSGNTRLSPFTIEVYTKDGDRIPIEIDTRLLLNREGDGDVVLGVARDLRMERRMQEEIRRSNSFLDHLLAVAPIGIVITDANAIIRDANSVAAYLCGAASANDLIGQHAQVFGWEAGTDASKILSGSHETHVELRVRLSVKTKFGRELNCDLVIAPLLTERHELEGFLILLADATERIALQQSILQSERMSALGEFVARAAHEINNPLTGIIGYSEYLHKTVTDSTVRQRIERLLDEGHRCRRIVDNLLNFAKRGEQRRAPTDLNFLLKETLALCEYALSVDNIRIELDLASNVPYVPLCGQDLQRAILNILNNAHHALLDIPADRRKVRIRTEIKDGFVLLSIADTGKGIPMEIRKKVFDPFFTTRGVGQGVGLGLSVAYTVATEHDGHITVDSELDKGSTFTLHLPVK